LSFGDLAILPSRGAAALNDGSNGRNFVRFFVFALVGGLGLGPNCCQNDERHSVGSSSKRMLVVPGRSMRAMAFRRDALSMGASK
jgi:hypothetical protein